MIELFWEYVKNFIFLSLFLLVAVIIKARVKFLQRYLVPTAIIGGFIGLVLGPQVAKLINFSSDTLGVLIYHLMAIGFIALALKDRQKRAEDEKGSVLKTGIGIISAYLMQAILGFGISLALAYTIFPDLFPPFGLLLPLGFGQGAGEAYSIGYSWEALGFTNGGNIGLSIAMIGLVWSIIPGIPLLNYLVRRKEKLGLADVKNIQDSDNSVVREDKINEKPDEAPAVSEKGKNIVIDKLTIQIALIGSIYLATFYLLKGISTLISPLGNYGQTISQLLWGFHFVIATLLAILVKMILNALNKRKWLKITYTDNYLLQRVADASFDYMIVASIAAISIVILRENWIPILMITTVGGIVTTFFTIFICKKIYKKNVLEHIAVLYGTWTGTISTGVALLREIDPDAKSNATEDLVLGSGVALPLGVPLMLVLGVAVNGFKTKNPMLYLYSILIFIAFFAVLMAVILIRKKPGKKTGK
jgi:glutamate:Na+ symporter, ESS family